MRNGESEETINDDPHQGLDRLLDDMETLLRKYVVLPTESEVVACVLWIAHTYVFLEFEATPYLAITSPEKRSGKTRLLDTIALLARNPWQAVLPSEPVVYRKIDKDSPTLLLDEVDTIFGPHAREHEGLRALLNAGHSRGVRVPRCIAGGAALKEFNVFCPKAIAGIGKLPDTVADRSIPIHLARRAKSEKVTRFRRREAREAARPLCERLFKWATKAELGDARPEVPQELNDRAADSWEPLFAIADVASPEWASRARRAAVELHTDPESLAESRGVILLRDIKRIFDEKDVESIFTRDLVDALCELEESPWKTGAQKWLTPHRLANLLRPYGIRPSGTIRDGEDTAKGYHRSSFAEAWERYVPSSPPENGG